MRAFHVGKNVLGKKNIYFIENLFRLEYMCVTQVDQSLLYASPLTAYLSLSCFLKGTILCMLVLSFALY